MSQNTLVEKLKNQLLEIEMARLTASSSEMETLNAMRDDVLQQLATLTGQRPRVAA